MRSVGDIVTLTASRGGWEGVILRRVGTPSPHTGYYVVPLQRDLDSAEGVIYEVDIESGHTDYPNVQVGDTVMVAHRGGEVTNVDGTNITVNVKYRVTRHLTFTRRHRLPIWEIWLKNPHLTN